MNTSRLLYLGLIAAPALCAGARAQARPSAGDGALLVTARSVMHATSRRPGPLKLLAAFELASKAKHFGGLSGLAFAADRKTLQLVSDRGRWYRARLRQDKKGRLLGLDTWSSGALLGVDGEALAGRRLQRRGFSRAAWDAEAISPRGTQTVIAFENAHRLLVYSSFDNAPHEHRLPAGLYQAPANAGMEAMTVLADGRILVLTEGHFNRQGSLRGWLQVRPGKGVYRPLSYQPSDGYLPTDLAPLPNGSALVLERMYLPLPFGKTIGPHARIRYVKARRLTGRHRIGSTSRAPKNADLPLMLNPPEVGRLDSGLLDNFEGLAVQPWGDAFLLYLVSDNNFRRQQKTLLYQLRWTPPHGASSPKTQKRSP